MKPRILISRAKDETAEAYVEMVEKAGGIAVCEYCPHPYETEFDGLVLTGGGDIDPYEIMERNRGAVDIDNLRDKYELELVNRCVCEVIPVFGICRGQQVVNVAMGGTVYQDMNDQLKAVHMQDENGKDRFHEVRISVITALEKLYGSDDNVIKVNSSHHQAVHDLGMGLYATARDEYGVVEALEAASLPIWTVQWHPETMHGEDGTVDGQKMFDFFVGECEKKMKV